MPTLNWIGKEAVIRTARQHFVIYDLVPHVLPPRYRDITGSIGTLLKSSTGHQFHPPQISQ